MKIIVVSHRVPFPPNKGEKLRTYYQLQFLRSQGHEIIVFCPTLEDADIDHQRALAKDLDVEVFGAPVSSKASRYIRSFLQGVSVSQSNFYSRHLQTLIDNHIVNADAVLCTASSVANYVKKSGNKLASHTLKLMDFMDVDSDKWKQYAESSSGIMRWVYTREQNLITQLEKDVAETFDTCFLIAKAEVDLFKEKITQAGNIQVLGNGIDTNEFSERELNNECTEVTFLFAGVMDYKPNVDAVLWFVEHCWPAICEAKPQAKFIIAGMNPEKAICKLHNTQNINVTGFVDDILPYFHCANIFVAPFHVARGVQNKILQAMSCGLPVVTTQKGGEGIQYQDGHDILVSSDAPSFTHTCLKLCEDIILRQQIGTRARETILQSYAWDSVLVPLNKALLEND